MQRRDFSRTLLTATAFASSASLVAPVFAQRVGFKEGTDYLRLPAPVPVAAPAGQIEVVEFFAYSCIHCFRFEPLLEAWIPKLAADVKVRRLPVAFSPAFEPMQRLYFALESMDLVEKLHTKVFKAFHEERKPLTSPEVITAWVVDQGVNRDKFLAAFNGSAGKLAAEATRLQDAYKVEGTPALGVAGRFYVSGQGPKTLSIADALIDQVRKG